MGGSPTPFPAILDLHLAQVGPCPPLRTLPASASLGQEGAFIRCLISLPIGFPIQQMRFQPLFPHNQNPHCS